MNKETIEFIDRTLLADGDYVSVGAWNYQTR